VTRALVLVCGVGLGLMSCTAPVRTAMPDERMTVSWSVAGLPPAYVQRRFHAEVPAPLQSDLAALLERVRFFDLPATMPGVSRDGRDMGSYAITVTSAARTHTVQFSDASASQDLANLRAWITDHLAPIATAP
jgi:hypothetical protein